MRIATGDETENIPPDTRDPAAVALGSKGGRARATTLSQRKRKQIAKKAANKRWAR